MADAAAGAGDGTADALGGGAEADVDALADDLEAQLVSRDEAGKLLGQTRRRRRLKEPKFSIIEAIGVESTSGSSTAGGDGGSIPLYRTYLICGPIRGWSDDGWWLSMLTTVRTLPALPCHEVYVQSVVHLVPGTYADDDDFCVRQTRIPFKLLDEIQVCADFSMLHWIHGMAGGSDMWRCVQKSGCDTLLFLRPRAHVERNENRTPEVVAEQWPLAVWTLASWSANHYRISIQFCSGTACVACPDSNNLLPVSDGDAFTIGVLTVLHCTGTLAKVLTHFALACQPEVVQDEARRFFFAITGKGKMDALYLREYRELVALVAARPYILSRDIEPVFFIIFKLVQLVNASWRASLGDEDAAAQSGAACKTRLAASILGPLVHEVKPLDPETKPSKTLSLYPHAPIAHLCHQVGAHRLDVAFV
eukprot:contig_14255_g3416